VKGRLERREGSLEKKGSEERGSGEKSKAIIHSENKCFREGIHQKEKKIELKRERTWGRAKTSM